MLCSGKKQRKVSRIGSKAGAPGQQSRMNQQVCTCLCNLLILPRSSDTAVFLTETREIRNQPGIWEHESLQESSVIASVEAKACVCSSALLDEVPELQNRAWVGCCAL